MGVLSFVVEAILALRSTPMQGSLELGLVGISQEQEYSLWLVYHLRLLS